MSSQEVTSQNTQEYGLQEEARERDRETDHFRYSLTYSRVSRVSPGRTEYGPGKEEEEVHSTSDGDDREQRETRGRSVFHELGQSQSRGLKERSQHGGEASEEPRKALTVAWKSAQEKSCID